MGYIFGCESCDKCVFNVILLFYNKITYKTKPKTRSAVANFDDIVLFCLIVFLICLIVVLFILCGISLIFNSVLFVLFVLLLVGGSSTEKRIFLKKTGLACSFCQLFSMGTASEGRVRAASLSVFPGCRPTPWPPLSAPTCSRSQG